MGLLAKKPSKNGSAVEKVKRQVAASRQAPPSAQSLAEKGLDTSGDYRAFLAALIRDVGSGEIERQIANTQLTAIGHVIRLSALELRAAARVKKQEGE